MGFICINCGADNVINKDTRNFSKSKPLRRRKRCLSCDYRFSSCEIPIEEYEKLMENKEKLENIKKLVGIVIEGEQ